MQVIGLQRNSSRLLGALAAALLAVLACVAWAGVSSSTGCAVSSGLSLLKPTNALSCLSKAITVVTGGTKATDVPATGIGGIAGSTTPAAAATGLRGVVSEGDSISVFWGGSYTGLYASSHPSVEYHGNAVSGTRIQGGNSLEERLAADLAMKPAVFTVLVGGADLGDGTYASADAWLAALWSYVAKVKASGAKVAVGTVLPLCTPTNTQYMNTTNQRRAIANAAIRKAVGTQIDAVIDFADDADMGPDSAACDTRWYKDGIHPTDGGPQGTGGEGRMFTIYTPVVDKLLAQATAAAGKAPVIVQGLDEYPVSILPVDQPATGGLTPIASNFDRAPLIVTGYDHGANGSHIPPSMAPDDVGAFRFICTAGQMSYDDPILYPGVKGGSAHLHQFYGNTQADYRSTYASLRTTGESTCSNPLNRSAYWAPALMNAAGQVIRPDYLSIYYKRHADNDPRCKLVAAEGCFDIPAGLRVVSGYDMSRMNEAQPENMTFTHRCATNQIHRATVAEAIADCGGAGQIITAITFGSCWDGRLDSPDHRAHVTPARYVGQAYAQCPADHPKLIPTLTQQIGYTVTKADGAVFFSSDRMNGMSRTSGSTFHADYMEGWDPLTRQTWHRNCIGKLLNCSDGELGDGTMLKRGPLTYVADPRLVAAPAR